MDRFNVPIGHIYLVMSDKVWQSVWEKKQRYPYLPDQQTLLRKLWEMNNQGGIPAVIGQYQGKDQLLLYTDSYYLALYETSWRTGYNIATLDIRNLNELNRLSKGALWIKAQEWHLRAELKSIPQGSNNYWDAINKAWHDFELQRQQQKPAEQQQEFTYAHEHYLDTVEKLIEATHQLEQEKFALNEDIAYKKVLTAGEERSTLRDIYDFRLAEIPQLTEQTMLQIKGFPDLRGRVETLEGTKLTLKFESLVDRQRIPEQGSFEPTVSQTIYKKQREALNMLREREAKNIHLLHVLADHVYQPYQSDRIAQNSDEDLQSLTPDEQFEAFRRALTVPDVLMVLGPPGTGKTRTITEIALHCGFLRHQRILMASGTHKAVDNVLERLPPDLIVIRVGHESNVSEKMRAKLIDVQAKELQGRMLENSENQANRLSRLLTGKHDIDGWMHQLAQGLGRLGSQESSLQQGYQRRSAAEQRVMAPFQGQLHELTTTAQQLQERSTKLQERIQTLISKQQKASERSNLPLLGWTFRAMDNHYSASIEQKQQDLQATQHETLARQQEYTQVHRTFQQALFADADYQQCEQYVRSQAAECEKTWGALVKIARILQGTTIDLEPQQPPLETKGSATLQHYLSWFQQSRAKLERKARLLQDWRDELSKSDTDQLYPELLRYADVVGATCIGAATVEELKDLDFDLAIIDEAGQIGLPNLLVPLVRAKRAVLVGDHHQLPPFVAGEVQNWLRNLSSPLQLTSEAFSEEDFDENTDTEQIVDLATKSAFEQLFMATMDHGHIVRFTKQGRMPRVIADFVSQHFYNNQLGTFDDAKMQHTIDQDPLFRHHLVVIDTSDEPSNNKWETPQRRLESLGETGYVNIAEARLIARIAEIYQKAGKDWVVIVPYRAQARRIIHELKQRLDDDQGLEERIATVHSFQGGERNKVIYGFTRSNRDGKIGFLSELRLLNVAMTRAQQQLVMVGNYPILTRANDAGFRHLVTSLYSYTGQHGERLSSAEAYSRIREAARGKDWQ